MKGVFTSEERAVVLFLTLSLLVGSVVVGSRRVLPGRVPDFGGQAAATAASGTEPEPTGPVDVNSADAQELDRLPGIGPARAAEIIRVRQRLGGFSSLDQLLEVRGIGPVTLGKLREHATVGGRQGASGPANARSDSIPARHDSTAAHRISEP